MFPKQEEDLKMVKSMVYAAKARRWNRSIAAFVGGGTVGAILFCGVGVGFLCGSFLAIAVWLSESKSVDRIEKIQKPWRD